MTFPTQRPVIWAVANICLGSTKLTGHGAATNIPDGSAELGKPNAPEEPDRGGERCAGELDEEAENENGLDEAGVETGTGTGTKVESAKRTSPRSLFIEHQPAFTGS